MQNSQNISDEQRKVGALTALAENFGKELSGPLLNMWLDLLAGYQADQVLKAVRLVIERYEFKTMPPFAVLKSALGDIAGTSTKSLELQAMAE